MGCDSCVHGCAAIHVIKEAQVNAGALSGAAHLCGWLLADLRFWW